MNYRMMMREAQIVFIHITELGIFKIHASKTNIVDRYYTTEEVVKFMNSDDLKVCILDKDEYIVEANFTLEQF